MYNNGTVLWLIGTVFEGLCELNMESYPLDSNACFFFIQPSVNDAAGLLIRNLSNGSDQVNFTEHGEWEIISTMTEVLMLKEPISGISYIGLSKTLQLSRRYVFILLHTCFPIFLLGWLNLVIFLVPLKSGERITFAVTVLLTFMVIISDISDQLPHNSLKLSLASLGITVVSVLCTFAVLTSVILCRLAHETVTPVPKCLIQPTRKFVEYKRNKCSSQKSSKTPVRRFSAVDDSGVYDVSKETFDNMNNEENVEIDWETVANMFDVTMFYANLIAVIVSDTVFSAMFFSRNKT